MEGHNVEQRVQIIKFYYQNQCSVREMFCVLRDFYPRHNRPAESTVRRLVVKFESTSSINNQPTPVRRRNARSAENIAAVRESVRENPRWSISCRSQELNFSATSTWRILRRDLDLHSYKIQLTQELKVNDYRQRRVFADWILEQLEVNPNFAKQIIFSDKVHFWMNGYVNKQNYRIWDDTNSREIHQLQMHPEKVCLVRILIWRNHRFVLLPKRSGIVIIVNGERYRSISNFLRPKMDTDNMWFQQDDATCHTACHDGHSARAI